MKGIHDIFHVLRKPRGAVLFLVDMLPVQNFLKTYKEEKKINLPLTPLLIKACAMTLKKTPDANYMMRGYKLVKPSSVDIGVSVAGKTRYAPVVVIRAAERKSLKEIADELARESKIVRAEEEKKLREISRFVRLIPFNFIRFWLIKAFMTRQRIVRTATGTFQLTNFGLFGGELAFTPIINTSLLGIGAVRDRVIVVDGKIEARPTSYFTIQGDHRTNDARTVGEFIHHMNDFMKHPELLLSE